MKCVEAEGKTLEDAIEQACEKMGASVNDLDIEVLSDRSSPKSIFGLARNKDTEIKILATLKDNREVKDEFLSESKKTLEEILKKLKVIVLVEAKKEGEKVFLNVKCAQGDSGGLLIGKGGQTLDALQHIVNKIINRSSDNRRTVVIDVEDYRSRKQEALTNLALRLGEKVKKFGKPITLKPMGPSERRIVHLALSEDSEVTTKSRGREPFREIIIHPKRANN